MATRKTKSTGISIFGIVFLIFLTLKLTGTGEVATWSWWVTSPLWLPFAAVVSMIVGFCTLGLIFGFTVNR